MTFDGQNIGLMIATVIGLVVLFLVLADLVPELNAAGDTLNQTGVPLGSLFAANGVVVLILMAAVILGVLKIFDIFKQRRSR